MTAVVMAGRVGLMAAAVVLAMATAACANAGSGGNTEAGRADTAAGDGATADTVAEEVLFGEAATGGDGDSAEEDAESVTRPAQSRSDEVSCTPAPDDLAEVSIRPSWQEGDVRDLELIVERTDPRLGDLGASTTPVTLEVTSADDNGIGFQWSSDTTTLQLDGVNIPEGMLDVIDIPPPPVAYRLDRNRAWSGVDNVDENREHLLEVFETIQGWIPAKESEFDLVALVTTWPDEVIGNLVGENTQILHAFEGVDVEVGRRYTFDDALPNQLGGAVIPGRTTIEVTELQDADGCVVIEMRTTVESEAVGEVVGTTLDELSDGATEVPEEAFDGIEFENVVTGRYDHELGSFRSVSAVQRITNGGAERVERRTVVDHTSP